MNKTIRISWKIAVALFVTLVFLSATTGQSPSYALERLSVDIRKTARLLEGGQSVELKGKVRCTLENFEVLEAFVYVVQDGNNSDFAPIPVTCSDRPNVQLFSVTVPALDFLFHPGEATANAFILLVDPVTQDTLSVSETETIQIR